MLVPYQVHRNHNVKISSGLKLWSDQLPSSAPFGSQTQGCEYGFTGE